jgi:CheY-like chemotaxis protein
MTESGLKPVNRTRIVIGVDDSPQDLKLLEQCIGSAGYTFLPASSGLECLKIVARVEPRLILLDVEMPDLDGYETCRRLRAENGLNHVPIAFLTAHNTPDDVKIGLAVGANDYILKPISVIRLMERVHYWTARRTAARGVLRSLG